MKKVDRHALILKLARQHAGSGKFRTFRDIEAQVRFVDGFPEARHVLDVDSLRRELEATCERHHEAQNANRT